MTFNRRPFIYLLFNRQQESVPGQKPFACTFLGDISMKRRFVMFLFLAAIAGQSVVRADEPGPSPDVPELRALQHYIGTWDVATTDQLYTKGESSAKWILGGRFVEQSGFMVSQEGSNRIEVLTLFTFDTGKKTYRSWTFLSDGSTSQAEMTWNAAAKTMTSRSRPGANGVRSTVTADFSEGGKERWLFVFTDRDGKAVGEMKGVNTRRKEAAAAKLNSKANAVSDRCAELKVLDRFLGTWHAEYRVPKAEWTLEARNGSADLIYTHELGGRIIRERGTHSDQTTSTLVQTFDSTTKNYRAWWFNSQGLNSESVGRWDEKSQTFNWTGVDTGEFPGSSQHQFVGGDKCDWKVRVQDKQGVAMYLMEGTSLRVKDAKKSVNQAVRVFGIQKWPHTGVMQTHH